MKKLVYESLNEFRVSEGDEPLALAVLGAPASGKSYTMKNITKSVKDARIVDTLNLGTNLTVDILRAEFQNKDPHEQLKGFIKAFYYIRGLAIKNPEHYSKWFKDIQTLWTEKLSKLIPSLNITVSDSRIKFNGQPALKNLNLLKNKDINPANVIKQLDNYHDYKRVVRYFQGHKQKQAIDKQMNVSYDETGDEPLKIIKNLKDFHNKGYVTDVFLLHPENVASNIIMNFFRVVRGGDDGRDSSENIIDAYNEIEKNKNFYKFNAEVNLKTNSKELQKEPIDPKIEDPIKNANVDDDKKKGNKPIDVLTQIEPMDPETAYKHFGNKLDKNQLLIFKALLRYSVQSLKNLPDNAKQVILNLTKDMNNFTALKILDQTAKSKKYIFKLGGITPELVKKAQTILK